MKILGIDTSTPVLSVAMVEDEKILESIHKGELTGPQLHGEILATLLEDLLAKYTIDAVAVGLGPGPYTGLRTGIAMGQAIAFAKGVEISGVSSLHALAHGFWRHGGQGGVAVIDAKRKEIAWQEFDEISLKGSPTLTPIDQISILEDKAIIGPAFVTQPFDSIRVLDSTPPRAEDVALLASQGLGQPLSPLYLRTPDVN